MALARAADGLGYETLWLAEHHFQHEGYECIPSIPMLAVDLAHRTERVKIGCAFNVVPAWHPLRLAEDYAVADILTKGRGGDDLSELLDTLLRALLWIDL